MGNINLKVCEVEMMLSSDGISAKHICGLTKKIKETLGVLR